MAASVYKFSDDVRDFYEKMPFPMAIYQTIDGKTKTVLVTDRMCEFYQMTREELIESLDTSMFEFTHPEDAPLAAYAGQEFVKNNAPYSVRLRIKLRGMEYYHVVHSIADKVTMPDGTVLGFFLYTDTDRRELDMEQVKHRFDKFQRDIIFHDTLTGLSNFKYLHTFGMEYVAKIKRSGRKPVLVYINLSGMKSYNTIFGINGGDELLVNTAKLMEKYFPDALLVRYMRDHFLILCDDVDLDSKLQKLQEDYHRNLKGGNSYLLAGIYYVDTEKDDVTVMIERAYFALQQIGNDFRKLTSVYDVKKDAEYMDEQYVLNCFDQAMKEGWIKVYYQPVYHVSSHTLHSLEALSRWQDPERGLLSPYQFIPTLEKYHLIWKLDFYMLGLVLKDLSERKHDGLPIYPVSINLAREDFEEENAVGQLLGRIDSYDIDRKYIIMEVTERDLAANDMHFKDVIDTLRSEGFSIWVDDFGSGYSSLNVMNAYKFDLIKLDMNFLRHLDDYGGANRVIMSSVIEAAHKLGITTLAEGVETEEHLNFLKEVSCDESQGYLYSKPNPLENLVDIL